MTTADKRVVGYWLLLGVLMIYIQVLIGGITRLTGSGLSITRWEIVTGTLPPLNEADWQEEFDLYKDSPQYQKVNVGMSLEEFKFIYFWEYFHRLWARLLGFVFLIPFVYFLVKKKLSKDLIKKAIIAFILGGLVGAFGWIMVASGLNDRPLVSPYKLALHLSLALLTYGYLLWVAISLLVPRDTFNFPSLKKFSYWITAILVIQIVFGALVSGMRAALFYPTWPDMNGFFIPPVLLEVENWTWNAFIHFEKYALADALFQFLHRMTAYLLVILIGIFIYKGLKQPHQKITKYAYLVLPVILIVQVLLGIFTLIYSISAVPVALGVIHQSVAILLLSCMLFINYRLS